MTIILYLNIWHLYFNRYLYNYFDNFHILDTLPVYEYTENKVKEWMNELFHYHQWRGRYVLKYASTWHLCTQLFHSQGNIS